MEKTERSSFVFSSPSFSLALASEAKKTKTKNDVPSSSLLCAPRALIAAPSKALSVGRPFRASPNAPKTGLAASESSLLTSLDAEI